jgi:urea transport system ATP-binding protein
MSRRDFARQALALGISASSIGLLLQACGRDDASPDRYAELGPLEKELHIYNWSDYIADDTVSNFEREFGVEVTYDTYESNEEMVAKLMAGAGGYDIVVPSGYIIPVLVATDLIRPLEQQYLTNIDNISTLFRELPGDPGGRHTVPWLWGTSGIAYRADRIQAPIDSWAVFHDPRYYGKTTMMDVITGKTKPDAGSVYFGQQINLLELSEHQIARGGIGRKFQKPTIFEALSVYENLELATAADKRVWRVLTRALTGEQRDRIDEVLVTIGLTAQRHHNAGALSHGQKQWLEIGMLLMQNPRVLLVDEPVAGMTGEEVEHTARLLTSLAGKHSVIVVEHDMAFVRSIARKVTVLHQGSVLAEGTMDQVQNNPKVIEVYLGE